MQHPSGAFRRLIDNEAFVFLPVAYDALGARLVEKLGFKAVYTGGFVTGSTRCSSEPLLTMDEQVRTAGEVANAANIPAIADGGAGFGDPLHTMRTVREFIRAGVNGIHIEDQVFPKRAHYHRAKAQTTSRREFVDKIRFACMERDRNDTNFFIIARTETCRNEGLEEASTRINAAADVGADMGLLFPVSEEQMRLAPRKVKVPLVYVLSRGNRDGRPVPTAQQLADMGYKAAIDAVTYLLVSYHFVQQAYREIRQTGSYSGLAAQDWIDARKEIEDIVGHEEFYRVEEETVEKPER